MAEGLRNAYKEIYDRSEYAHDMPKDKFKNLIVEITGLQASDPTVNAIVGTFSNLRAYAKFDAQAQGDDKKTVTVLKNNEDIPPLLPPAQNPTGLNLSYTINLNLPETSDVEVFNAIFRSLKENLLKV